MRSTTSAQGRRITSFAALEEVLSWSNVLARVERLELLLPGLTPEENSRYESLIHEHTSACGCAEGRVFLCALVVGYVLYLLVRAEGLSGAGWRELGIGFGLACLGALIGKAYGLIHARLRLRVVADSLRRLSTVGSNGR